MLGHKERQFKEHTLHLEQCVPRTNFYRQVEAKLDLSFVTELVKDCYSPSLGRPSIDPIVFFKLQLIMFFEGIRSERQLMDIVSLNLAHRWYTGYDLDEALPDHSSLSKIRTRYGLHVFEQFFEHIVEQCIEAGLVWGKELYFDGTKVRANAAVDKMVSRWYWEAKQHVTTLFASQLSSPEPPAAPLVQGQDTPSATADLSIPEPSSPGLAALVEKYDGTRLNDKRTVSYERVTDRKVSLTDPDATPMSRFTGDRAKLGYHTQYVVDGGKRRIILAALVTPASVMDNTPMLDLERWVRFRWRLKPKIAVGDTKFGTVENIVGLAEDGIMAYLPTADFSQRNEFYALERFTYDAERDLYTCPNGKELRLHSRRQREEVFVYRALAKTCNVCPLKAKCTDSQSGRHIFRSFYQADVDRARGYRETEAYEKAMRKRQVWVEPLFGEGKQWHEMGRFRLRGLAKVNIEGVMRAAGQNIKRLLTRHQWDKPRLPAAPAALPVSFPCFLW
ncbi:MAG: IS1182 family transposase [Anaerolineae bacterium]